MKKIFILTVLFSSLFATKSIAQDVENKRADVYDKSGLALSIGAAVDYYYGKSSRNFDKFESERVNWQANAMVGLTIARDRGGRRTMLGAFGAYGFNNESTIRKIFADQNYNSLVSNQSDMNNFYQVEGGLLLGEVLRVSTGIGRQSFNEQALAGDDFFRTNATYLEYYSSTVGLNLNVGKVVWTINCNFAYGKDYNSTVLNPNTGISFRF